LNVKVSSSSFYDDDDYLIIAVDCTEIKVTDRVLSGRLIKWVKEIKFISKSM